ncbi:MAG: (5-formylfuran-3-yl)methyl phosphate synthase [Methylococcales bacterium]|nr:(5-formylfuran-3-yl)methyl phosphate synthase [Methylococcales bacterium]
MTAMLASVNSLEEAQLIINTTIDIIDLKQPEQGALGALSTDTVTQIVQFVNQQKPISATIGDLPMQADLVYNAVTAMTKTGVDYIKIGFFPDGDWQSIITSLGTITQQGHRLIAVLFADTQPDLNTLKQLKKAGFIGVMLDTMNKSKGSLLQVMPLTKIDEFVTLARHHQLLCGLAGSLKQQDISKLMPFNADYLGFRGALCENHNRTAQLNNDAINLILSYFK